MIMKNLKAVKYVYCIFTALKIKWQKFKQKIDCSQLWCLSFVSSLLQENKQNKKKKSPFVCFYLGLFLTTLVYYVIDNLG